MTDTPSIPRVWTRAHLAALQKARCETQAELAKAVGVAPNTVYRWLAGRGYPTRPVVVRELNELLKSLEPEQRERYDYELGRIEDASGGGTSRGAPLAGPASKGQQVHRRGNLQLIGAIAVTGLSPKTLSAPATAAETLVTGELVGAREGIMSALAGAYHGG